MVKATRLVYPDDYYSQNYAGASSLKNARKMPLATPMALGMHNSVHGRRSIQISNSKIGERYLWQDSLQVRCFRCIASGHKIAFCKNDFRCRFCFGYEHISRDCRAKLKEKQKTLAYYPKNSVPRRESI